MLSHRAVSQDACWNWRSVGHVCGGGRGQETARHNRTPSLQHAHRRAGVECTGKVTDWIGCLFSFTVRKTAGKTDAKQRIRTDGARGGTI